jgi:hypothetical protein
MWSQTIPWPSCLITAGKAITCVTVRLYLVVISQKNIDRINGLKSDWSNFEIADMDFWRGEAYQAFFQYLESKGGFYYEVCVAMLLESGMIDA